ncbi:MAG: c-type cytochrome [Acidobacteriota bacterium]|nr:c-type cytochrome [Acidobacteriota bacterium]
MRRLLVLAALLTMACHPQDDHTAQELTGGLPARGHDAIQKYGCGACHEIPGVDGANGMVGPSLRNIADRMYLAGQVPNTPDNMKMWILQPQRIEHGTAMPNLNVTQGDANDIAAYLYTLRQ